MNEKLNVHFYKRSGKWYASGTATTTHYLFDERHKQDIVDTQDQLSDEWVEHDFYVVVENADPNTTYFHNALYKPGAFLGINLTSKKEE